MFEICVSKNKLSDPERIILILHRKQIAELGRSSDVRSWHVPYYKVSGSTYNPDICSVGMVRTMLSPGMLISDICSVGTVCRDARFRHLLSCMVCRELGTLLPLTMSEPRVGRR